MDNFRAQRQFERFLFLTPHDNFDIDDEGELIATIIYHNSGEVEIIREDEKNAAKS